MQFDRRLVDLTGHPHRDRHRGCRADVVRAGLVGRRLPALTGHPRHDRHSGARAVLVDRRLPGLTGHHRHDRHSGARSDVVRAGLVDELGTGAGGAQPGR